MWSSAEWVNMALHGGVTQSASEVFITTCPFGQVQYKFNIKKTLAQMTFLLAPKIKRIIFILKVICLHNSLLACPIRAIVIFIGLSKCLPRAIRQVLMWHSGVTTALLTYAVRVAQIMMIIQIKFD